MGSWDETCALTNIAIIAGDPCVQVYFQMPAFDYYLCCAGDVTGLAPYLTRVVDVTAGDYNDYGGIEGDTTNKRENTAKDLFGPIERDVTQDRTASLFFHKEAWDMVQETKGAKANMPRTDAQMCSLVRDIIETETRGRAPELRARGRLSQKALLESYVKENDPPVEDIANTLIPFCRVLCTMQHLRKPIFPPPGGPQFASDGHKAQTAYLNLSQKLLKTQKRELTQD